MLHIFRFPSRCGTAFIAAGALCIASTGAFAAGNVSAQKFVTKAGDTNLMEIKLGQLAQHKSSNSAVDEFAKQMVDDHTQLQNKLQQTAQSENLNVPSEIPGKMQKKYHSMAKLSGDQFNKAYARFNVKGHKEAVALFKKEKQSKDDPAVSKLAAEGLSTIESHYQMAQKLSKTVNGGERAH